MYFKGGKTIKNLLVAPEDKDHTTKTSGVIYSYKCDRVECDEYIGRIIKNFWGQDWGTCKTTFPNI